MRSTSRPPGSDVPEIGPKIVALVSGDPSDLYFLNQVFRRLPVVGGVVDRSGEGPSGGRSWTARLGYLLRPRLLLEKVQNHRFWVRHHARCRAVDEDYFGRDGFRVDPAFDDRVLELDPGEPLNGTRVVEYLRYLAPDMVLTCGCSLLDEELLAIPPHGTLNLHGGLSQRYRGLWTTLWAVYNGEPEWVGCTVHFVNAGVDDGPIVAQERPQVVMDDDPESLYAKVVCGGVDLVVEAVERSAQGELQPCALLRLGRVYRARDVTREVIAEAFRRAPTILADYLRDRARRDAPVEAVLEGGEQA